MSTADPFGFDNPEPVKKPLSGCAIAAIVCGVLFVIFAIVAGLGAWWLKNNFRQVGTDFATSTMKEALKEVEIPDDQRQRIDARIDSVGQQFKDGELEFEQVGAIFEKISQSPLMSAGMSLFFKRAYLKSSGLSAEEKAAAEVSIQRFVRAVIDKSIPQEASDAALDLISSKDADGARQFQEKLSDDEIRAFLAAITTAADEAGIPATVPEFNFADEFDKAIDEALSENSVTAEMEEESPATGQ